MRTRKEIEEGEIVIDSRGHPYQKESFEYRTLEVLLDIRDLLTKQEEISTKPMNVYNS